MKVPNSQKTLYKRTSTFLFAISRLEYAMKSVGFIRSDGEAEWGRFAEWVAPLFETPSEKLLAASTCLLENPPQKLKLRDGILIWEEARPPIAMATGDLVLLYLRRLRRNCFQGGEGTEPAPEQRLLLKCGTRIVRELLRGIPDIEVAFYS